MAENETDVAALREQIAQLRELCSEMYQVAGTLGADERVLDSLLATAEGRPLPHESLLPYPGASA